MSIRPPFSDGIADVAVWPAFVDLLAATAMFFVAVLAVVLAWVGWGRGGDVRVQTETLYSVLSASPAHVDSVYRVTPEDLLVRVTFLADATFPVGEFRFDSMKDSARVALRTIAALLQEPRLDSIYREVRVVGHTDQDPIRDSLGGFVAGFSNWELSASRAAVVARFLDESGVDPCKISATGQGPYFPVDGEGSGSALSRDAKRLNRRIELEIVPSASRARDGAPVSRRNCLSQGDGAHGGGVDRE